MNIVSMHKYIYYPLHYIRLASIVLDPLLPSELP